jgi:hypothetical protein
MRDGIHRHRRRSWPGCARSIIQLGRGHSPGRWFAAAAALWRPSAKGAGGGGGGDAGSRSMKSGGAATYVLPEPPPVLLQKGRPPVHVAIVLLMKNPSGPTGVGVCFGDADLYSGEATGEMARRGAAESTTFSCCSPTSCNRTLAVNPWESHRCGDSTGKRSRDVQLFGNTGDSQRAARVLESLLGALAALWAVAPSSRREPYLA